MRKLIALVAASAALFVAGLADAAPVNVILTQTAPGANTWDLTLSWTDPLTVAAMSVNISSSAAGTFATSAAVSPCTTCSPSGFSLVVADSPTNLRLALGPVGEVFATGPQTSFLLGTWTGPATAAFQVNLLPGNILDGGTVQDADFAEVPFTLSVVPEPAAIMLLGIGLGALSLARRKSA